MAKSAKKTTARRAVSKSSTKAARSIITDAHVIKVNKGAKNPFTGPVQVAHAAAVLKSNGKTVEAAKKAGTDSWTVRKLVELKLITVSKAS